MPGEEIDLSAQQSLMRLSDAEFDSLMAEIDGGLAGQDFAIFQRGVQAIRALSLRKNVEINYLGPVAQRINDWMSERYGERLKADLDIGAVPVFLGGDIYKLRIPLAFGRIQISVDPRTMGTEMSSTLNLLDMVEDLTVSRAKSLTLEECAEIERGFHLGFKAFSSITRVSETYPFIREAREDLRSALSRLCLQRPSYGLAKWDLLQTVEKFFKGYIQHAGVTPTFTHSLQVLAGEAETLGLPRTSHADLALVQCDAGVRYNTARVSAGEAMQAYFAAMRLCAAIAEAFQSP